jgi:hypothetical protein
MAENTIKQCTVKNQKRSTYPSVNTAASALMRKGYLSIDIVCSIQLSLKDYLDHSVHTDRKSASTQSQFECRTVYQSRVIVRQA